MIILPPRKECLYYPNVFQEFQQQQAWPWKTHQQQPMQIPNEAHYAEQVQNQHLTFSLLVTTTAMPAKPPVVNKQIQPAQQAESHIEPQENLLSALLKTYLPKEEEKPITFSPDTPIDIDALIQEIDDSFLRSIDDVFFFLHQIA